MCILVFIPLSNRYVTFVKKAAAKFQMWRADKQKKQEEIADVNQVWGGVVSGCCKWGVLYSGGGIAGIGLWWL